MSLFPSDPGEIKDSGYLVAEAISLAYRLGLNYDPVSMTTNTREIGLRKRLWWAVYIRDKEVSLEADRPKTIGRDDFDVPDLLQSDFDLNAPCPRHHDGCPGQECASNERKKSAIQFMHRAKRAQDPEGVDYASKVRYWKFDPWTTGDLEVTGGLIPELGG
ncbi:hypothetical protein PENSTE_c012G04328 [Penicillium steckii]|uniref:Xylanolytic transcriptional activator regulatory domain-containing protein n=1 Tax=Penicillium steckii TaxID=303698 RepID=A0A1V6T5F1_9EURO|nr:hypothetical protein PENSTE_c012G04328 [Penicillium steckii]